MCGIAGVIHRGAISGVGAEMTSMLQALRHRGPDSTGFAIYGTPAEGDFVMRFKVAEQEDMASGFDIHGQIRERLEEVDRRLAELGVTVRDRVASTEYAMRYVVSYDGDMEHLARYVEDVEGAEILSLGGALELVKDLGDATVVAEQYDLGGVSRHARHRSHPHGHRVRRRHPVRPSVLGVSLQRRRGRPQRADHELLADAPGDGAQGSPVHVRLRLRAARGVHRAQPRQRGAARRVAGTIDSRDRRRLHLPGRHPRPARHGQGHDGGQAARALRERRPHRARLRGGRDPRHPPRGDRHLRPLRRGDPGNGRHELPGPGLRRALL